jgi:hypothetical protein
MNNKHPLVWIAFGLMGVGTAAAFLTLGAKNYALLMGWFGLLQAGLVMCCAAKAYQWRMYRLIHLAVAIAIIAIPLALRGGDGFVAVPGGWTGVGIAFVFAYAFLFLVDVAFWLIQDITSRANNAKIT